MIEKSVAVEHHLYDALLLAPAGNQETLADALQRWFALEEFLRTELPIRIVMKPADTATPHAASVPWLLETRNAIMWVEAN